MFEMPDPFGRTKPKKHGASVGPLSLGQARAWAAGMEVAYGLIGMGLIGFAIDYFAGTLPRWMLIMGGIGLVWGVYRFVRTALDINTDAARSIEGRVFRQIPDEIPGEPPDEREQTEADGGEGDAGAAGVNPDDLGGFGGAPATRSGAVDAGVGRGKAGSE